MGRKRVKLLKESFKNQIKVTRRNVINGRAVCEWDRDGRRYKVKCQAGSRCVGKVQLPSTISISTRRKVCKDTGIHVGVGVGVSVGDVCVCGWWHWQCQRQGEKETAAFNLELHRCQGRSFLTSLISFQAFTLTLRWKVLERSVM